MERLGLNLQSIIIEGNSMVSDNRILSIMNLKYGQNILTINVKNMEEKVGTFPRIKDVKIKRDFPDSLKVYVEEVTPVGYLMEKNERYVVTLDGDIFPGTEGPDLKFKVKDKNKIRNIVALLIKIKNIDKDFYNKIRAIDSNYKDEIIINKYSYYIKWSVITELNDETIKRNIYLEQKTVSKYKKRSKKNITYIDLRFVKIDNDKIMGAVLVK